MYSRRSDQEDGLVMATRTYLAGGLGNQLFQLAASLYVARGNQVVLESRFAHTRLNDLGIPDLANFKLPKNVSIDSRESRSILSRATNLGLRMGADNASRITIYFLQFAISALMLVFEKRICRTFINRGVGYDPRIENCSKDIFLIGYFQTHRLADHSAVNEELRQLALVSGLEIEDLPAAHDEFIFVHMRLGDYLQANSFGIPNKFYYENGVSKIRESNHKLKLLVFSDDPLEAEIRLDSILGPGDVVLTKSTKSAAENLETLKKGKYFVIGNSTFSWWAAYLSNNQTKQIVSPTPWFKSAQIPQELIPEDWTRIAAF